MLGTDRTRTPRSFLFPTVLAAALCTSALWPASPAIAQDPDYELGLEANVGTVGALLDMPVTLDNVGEPLEAWSFDVCNDDLISIGAGDVARGSATDPLDFEFESVLFEATGFCVSGILEVGTELAIGDDLELYIATYSLDTVGLSELSFCGDLTAIELTLVGGATVEPTTGIGTIDIADSAGTEPFFFAIEDQTVTFDPDLGTGELVVEVTVEENPANVGYPNATQGLSFGVVCDETVLEPNDGVAAGEVADIAGGTGPDFLSITVYDGGFTYGAVYDFFGLVELELDGGPVAELTFDFVASALIGLDAPVVTEVEFSESVGTFDVEIIVVVEGFSNIGGVENATITLEPEGFLAEPIFKRGDVDANGVVSPLLDALFLLQFAFSGGLAPICEDATDVDNNGTLSALVDSLALLGWAFGALDVPPDPGVEECGPDPEGDTDGIDCETAPVC